MRNWGKPLALAAALAFSSGGAAAEDPHVLKK
jgi:hypothetical protein